LQGIEAELQGVLPALNRWLLTFEVVLLEQAAAASLDLQEDRLRIAPQVDGLNLKLLKTIGLRDALLMARVAGRLNLDLMVGCYFRQLSPHRSCSSTGVVDPLA